ncbi:SDR family oxidoreductase [Celeribacter sp.]|uniref:SDR family oxidoreductase n=1 Tax=Celeribacter sp. TaxID=1890673 RepID=UPI003A915791
MSDVVLITGAATGIGRLTAETLARGGHIVYASMRDVAGRNAPHADALASLAQSEGLSLHTVEMDILSDSSVDAATNTVIAKAGRIDVLMHNAGHLVLGPTEAFTPEEVAQNYAVNVLGAHRVNRAVLPVMRAQEKGTLLWISSTTVHGGFPPFLGPYGAAKAAMDSLAGSLALEVSRFGIETVIVSPGAFTVGTEHFPKASPPEDHARAEAYARYDDVTSTISDRLSALMPDDAHPQVVADAVLELVNMPHGTRPFRTVVDLLGDGAEEVAKAVGRVRQTFFERIDLADLLSPQPTS